MATKEFYMSVAIQLAKAVAGQTSPNPAVGCVVVKDGKIVGMGAHMKAGEGHAEAIAIDQAGERAYGADLYVTLEPCSHVGKTPACAALIIDKQIKSVFIASEDPNPLVSGRGIDMLKKAGMTVETGILEKEALEINKFFFHYIQTKTPFVTLKTAATLDGKTAAVTGDSKWITSEAARLDVHELRDKHDAILTGIQTVIYDNPQLTTRLPQGGKNPIRIILDTSLQIPLDANVVTDGQARTIIVCGKDASVSKEQELLQADVEVKRMDTSTIHIDTLLYWLGEQQIISLFVEGGGTVHGSFVEGKFFQQIIMYIAPKILGDRNGISSFNGSAKKLMAESARLAFKSIEQIGPDLKIIAIPDESKR